MTDPTYTPRRRSIMRGAAWTAPVITTALAAPAFAASPCKSIFCPDISFRDPAADNATSTGNGWSFAPTGGWKSPLTANPVGFMKSVAAGADPIGGKGPWFAATNEPNSVGRVLTLTQTGQPALNAGCRYTLKVGVVTYTDNGVALVLRAFAGGTQIAQNTTSGNAGAYVDEGIQSYSVTAGTSGVISFKFVFNGAANAATEDIKLYQPSVTCETP